jgi:putative ABC transport system permease protein
MQFVQILRNLTRDSFNTIVIIVSLTVGLTTFNLIVMFLSYETGTDRFHADADRIYAMKSDNIMAPGTMTYETFAGSAEYITKNFAQVEDFCRIYNSGSPKLSADNNDYYDHPIIMGTSKNFFTFFSYKLLSGDPKMVLDSPNSIVISSDIALKYFGTTDVIGKAITSFKSDRTEQMMVTGVFSKPLENTQLNFDMVRLLGDLTGRYSRCYIKLKRGTKQREVEDLFLKNKEAIPISNTGIPRQYHLESLKDAYFDPVKGSVIESNRNKNDLWVAISIGLLVIGVAIFNYLGVISNKFKKSIRSLCIRRINGSSFFNLVAVFALENALVILFSGSLSLILLPDLLPLFNDLTESHITPGFIFSPKQLFLLSIIVFLLILVTFLISYLLLRTNLTVRFLSPGFSPKIQGTHIPFLNILQLAVSVGLLLSSLVILKQIKYISSKAIGIDKEVVEVRIPGQYKQKAAAFREELMKNSTIENVSLTTASPLLEHYMYNARYNRDGVEKRYSLCGFGGDENYLSVLGIEVVEGEGFSEGNNKKCVINESLAQLFKAEDLLGKRLPGMEDFTVTGIVRDFNYSSLKSIVEPSFISYDNTGFHLLVKSRRGLMDLAKKQISETWNKFIPDYPLDIESVRDRYEWYHRENKKFITLIGSCSAISVFLSMIGLFAAAYNKTRLRIKEIGLRKINGAKTGDILFMINSDFIRWTLIAFVMAIPPSWYVMHRWLENYVYKTDITIYDISLSGIIILIVSLLTVSFQSWRAATRNPVEALRYE